MEVKLEVDVAITSLQPFAGWLLRIRHADKVMEKEEIVTYCVMMKQYNENKFKMFLEMYTFEQLKKNHLI